MKIVVCVKQVPDTAEVRIDPQTNNLVREGVPSIPNPCDLNGVEAALRLREAHGGSVTVVSMGPPQAARALEYCLQMGADEAILLSDRAVGGSDTLATGYALSNLLETQNADLVICGIEAIDGCTGQVGPILAGSLKMTQFTYVRELSFDNDKLSVLRDTGKMLERYEAELPALVCVCRDINRPRKPGTTEQVVRTVTAAELGLDPDKIGNVGSPTRVVKIEVSSGGSKSYVEVDDSLSWEDRIRVILAGGIERKAKINLWRGAPAELAQRLLENQDVSRYIHAI